MFASTSVNRSSHRFNSRRRATDRVSKRRFSIEYLERRDLFAVIPMAPITFGGQAVEAGYAIAVDEANNRYLTGVFSETVDFDPGPGVTALTSNGDFDIFVAKYYADGSLAWARGFGSQYQDTASDWRQSIAVDGSGNVYVLTSFADTVAFDNIVLSSTGTTAGWKSNVVLCLDSVGNVEWAKSFGNSTYAGGFALHNEIDAPTASSVYVAGRFTSTQQFGSQQLTPSGGGDGFLSRLDAATGDFVWTKKTTGKGDELFTDVAVDSAGAGAVYVTGYKFDEAIIGSFKFDKRSGRPALVAKADLDGNFQWAKVIATSSHPNPMASGWDIAVANGGVVVTGFFQAEYAYFDNIRVRNMNGRGGGNDLFVTRLNLNGNVDWALGVGSDGNETARRPAIAADMVGNVYLVGVLAGQAQLGADTLPAGHFVAQIDAANGQFLESWPLAAGIQFRNINTDPVGNLWITGLFEGTATFPDGTTLTSTDGSQDLFYQQFSNSPAAPWITSQKTPSSNEPHREDVAKLIPSAAFADNLFVEPETAWTRKARTKFSR